MKKKSQYKEGNFGAIYKFDHGYLCNLTKFSDCQDKLCRDGYVPFLVYWIWGSRRAALFAVHDNRAKNRRISQAGRPGEGRKMRRKRAVETAQ